MQIPTREAAHPNVEDGVVICRCVRGRKRYLDIRLPTFVRDTEPVLRDGRSVQLNFVENLFSFVPIGVCFWYPCKFLYRKWGSRSQRRSACEMDMAREARRGCAPSWRQRAAPTCGSCA